MPPAYLLLAKLAANILLASSLSRLLQRRLGQTLPGLAGSQLLPLWPALVGSLLLSSGRDLSGVQALEPIALVLLGWRGGYYFNMVLDHLLASEPAPQCHVCDATQANPRFIRRQGLDFCSHNCWYIHLKNILTVKPVIFDQQVMFIRQEVYPMSFSEYSPPEALELLQGNTGYVYVDVRSTPEYELCHPAGAYNVPLFHRQATGMTPNPDFLQVMEKAFPPESKLLVGCQSGQRSARAAEALVAAGYTCVANVRGGFGGVRDQFGRVVEKGWLELGLPVEQGSPADQGYAALALKEKE